MTCAEMDSSGTGVLTLAKFDHAVGIRVINLIREAFARADASSDRQLIKREFMKFAVASALSSDAASTLWGNLDTNGNGKVNFKEFRDWASTVLDEHAIDTLLKQ